MKLLVNSTLLVTLFTLIATQITAQKRENQGWYVKNFTELSAQNHIDGCNKLDPIEGIWQSSDGFKYAIVCNPEGEYRFRAVVLESSVDAWKPTEIKGFINYGSVGEVYTMKYYTRYADGTGLSSQNVLLVRESPITLSFQKLDGSTIALYRLYPKAENYQSQNQTTLAQWSGSCIAIGNQIVATNYHVVDGAQNLVVTGLNGDKATNYRAEVILTDKVNDLAVMKITDSRFTGFNIKYGIKSNVADIGTDIFVLGYPMTATMGEDIKLTTGVVSAKTGFQGDVSQYQISAPIQPGNSGGPLFDNEGNLIGIVSAKHTGAENVGYAIKLSYLRNLLDSSNEPISMNAANTISSKTLPEKVKAISPCVLLVKANVALSPNASPEQTGSRDNGTNQETSEEDIARSIRLGESANEKFNRQDYVGAYADICKSVELFPNPVNQYAKGWLAATYYNNADVAIEALEYCLGEKYNEANCWDILSRAYQAKGNYEKAIFYYNKVLDINGKYVDAYVNRALCYDNLEKTDEAIADYLKAIKYDGIVESSLYALAYNNVAYKYLGKEDLEKAKGYIEKSIEHNHMYGFSWDTYGELCYKIGEYRKCIECMSNAITICKVSKENEWIGNSYMYRGLAKKALGDMAGAKKDLENAAHNGSKIAISELSNADAVQSVLESDKSYDVMYPNPRIRRGSSALIIKGVEKNDESTIVYCQYTNTEYNAGGWYSINAEAYIRDKSTGKTQKLIATENCAVEPYRTSIGYGETNSFTLYFPPISKDAEEIDLIEPGTSEWKLYGIKLKQ